MQTFFKKLIPHNIAGIVGVVQALIPLLRELAIVVIRIADIFTPGEGLEPLIKKVKTISDSIEGAVESFKDMFLGLE